MVKVLVLYVKSAKRLGLKSIIKKVKSFFVLFTTDINTKIKSSIK